MKLLDRFFENCNDVETREKEWYRCISVFSDNVNFIGLRLLVLAIIWNKYYILSRNKNINNTILQSLCVLGMIQLGITYRYLHSTTAPGMQHQQLIYFFLHGQVEEMNDAAK